MKKITITFLLLMFFANVFAQEVTSVKYPDITYSSLEGQQINIQTIFEQNDLSIVVFWAPNSNSIRQVMSIEKEYEKWNAAYDMQIIFVSMGNNLERAKNVIDRYKGKMNCKILLDEYVIEKGKKTILRYSSTVPDLKGSSPSIALVSKNSEIVNLFDGLTPQDKLNTAVEAYFE